MRITMKQWRIEMAERLGVKPITVAGMLRRGALPRPKVERINARVVFVIQPVNLISKKEFTRVGQADSQCRNAAGRHSISAIIPMSNHQNE